MSLTIEQIEIARRKAYKAGNKQLVDLCTKALNEADNETLNELERILTNER